MLSIVPKELPNSDLSIVGISSFICRDGFDSWKIHVFDFVDFFRQAKDLRLIFLPPMSCLDGRLKALLASIVCQLCSEIGCIPPDWALQEYYLEKPWFVSEIQSLKATTILESPLAFRRNNIFVLKNFLQRA